VPADGHWGVPVRWSERTSPTGSRVWNSPIKEEADIAKLAVPRHAVDETATERRAARLRDAVGDIVPLWIDRGPVWQTWAADLSTDLAKLRGLEQMMWDMTDRPDWLRRLLAFMRDGVLKAQEEAEKAGDWSLGNHNNQAMPYAEELPDPAPEGYGVPRKKLWVFCASQETTLVGPAMFEEFMLAYQRPIIERFGLASYGCCEDLTRKIPVLRKIANLRRIAVAPVANVAACAEQIGGDYILSYRPSPADMVSYRFDPERVRTILRRDLAACRDCHVDITLKDVETVEGDPDRIRRWVGIVREVIGA